MSVDSAVVSSTLDSQAARAYLTVIARRICIQELARRQQVKDSMKRGESRLPEVEPDDAPAAVIHSSNNGAELDYGPRGPQHRGNAQLLPAH